MIIANKTVLVTGANRGIGRALVVGDVPATLASFIIGARRH